MFYHCCSVVVEYFLFQLLPFQFRNLFLKSYFDSTEDVVEPLSLVFCQILSLVSLLEAPKVVFMTHGAQSRLFQQWSYKVLDEENPAAKGLEEEDESTETLVCSVLAALQNLSKHLELSKMALPGLLLDKNPELIVSQNVLGKLLARGELLSPQLYLQMYDSPVNIRMTFGQGIQGSCLTTI
ncbi:hypothetical protein JOB18_017730 [Solea senegalensis]|uniref:Uncharacterized protein n=1 Tax=Solea senegalensis TaxID=28829 RepID=A0AAV6RRA2_SOLSE|nr:hypothetical protein JOB18_017730 [Solea senegalensis]